MSWIVGVLFALMVFTVALTSPYDELTGNADSDKHSH